MSAADELRKLAQRHAAGYINATTFELVDALPEIIAVVETAQYVHGEPYESDAWWNALGSDLAALSAKLGEA